MAERTNLPILERVFLENNSSLEEVEISDCPSVTRMNLYLDESLTYLDVSTLQNLIWIDARGTAIKTIDVRGAVSLELWRKSSKGWWYGNPEGWYAKNATLSIDGKDYSFDKNGYLK